MFEVDMRSFAARQRIDPQVGDEVTIVGTSGNETITITDLAEKLGTIEHEACINFSQRMPRIYV